MNSIEFLSNLKLTQFGLRWEFEHIKSGIYYAGKGPIACKKKIAIIDTHDGNFWIRDGLHRCLTILNAGRGLLASEFIIEHFSYEDMNSINLSVQYYTPFDLKTEVRLTDLSLFRHKIGELKTPSYMMNPPRLSDIQRDFILKNKHLYKTNRLEYHNSLKEFSDFFFK